MYDTAVGTFKSKAAYKEAAKIALCKYTLNGNKTRVDFIRAEYQIFFGHIKIVQHSCDIISITNTGYHHVDYISREDVESADKTV